MDKNKIIKDIRIYESDKPNIEGNPLPGELGKIYKFDNSLVVPICQRIARKLNEYKFCSGVFDHIYINLTTVYIDKIVISNRIVEKWIKYVDYGLKPESINELNSNDQSKMIHEIIFKSLYLLYSNDFEKIKLINKVKIDIEKYNSELEILYKSKKTSTYEYNIYYKIKPNGNSSCVIFEYKNIEKKYYFKNKVFDLDYYEDIYYLIGNVKIHDRVVTFIPKSSYTASLCNKRYNFPLSFYLK